MTSYPEFRFGNIFDDLSLTELLRDSPARRRLLDRPGRLIQQEDCIECEHLAICHGGCPIRTYSTRGSLIAKDPYCETYKLIFAHMRDAATRVD